MICVLFISFDLIKHKFCIYLSSLIIIIYSAEIQELKQKETKIPHFQQYILNLFHEFKLNANNYEFKTHSMIPYSLSLGSYILYRSISSFYFDTLYTYHMINLNMLFPK